MSLVVNTNVASLLAQHRLDVNNTNLQRSMARLSSGKRINRASDDAAGLAISQNIGSQIRRMQQASRNTQDGISVLQVAEGTLSSIGDNLQRIRELTVQAANDTYDATARAAITTEIQTLAGDIDRLASAANFNGMNLLDGSHAAAGSAPIQTGPDSLTLTNTVDLSGGLQDTRSAALQLVGGSSTPGFATIGAININSATVATQFLGDVDRALTLVNAQRGTIGALQNKLESVANNLDLSVDNFSASKSRIQDVDVAAESANMVQSQILTEAATTVLAQTNNLPQMILKLLQK